MKFTRKGTANLVAVVGCGLVLVIRLALHVPLAEQARLLPFVLPVIGAAWLGGHRPGLLATAIGVFVGVLFVVPPAGSLSFGTLADGLNAAIFCLVGVTISYICEELHSAKRREAEQHFRLLADSIPQLVWMARPDGERFWFNRRWQEYTGTTAGQLEHAGWHAFHDAKELPRVLESWRSAVNNGQPWEETYPLRDKHGRMRWHLARAIPIRGASSRIECWFGTTTDIQDRMEAEQSLKEADARKDEFLAMLATN